MEDLYNILGVKRDSTLPTIRKAYKKKASDCHPDKNQDDPEATVKFQALTKAYEILKDKEKREQYDRTGRVDDAPSLDEEAKSIIAKIFIELAEREGFSPKNYLEYVTKALQNALRQCTLEKAKITKSFDKLEYLIESTEADELFLMMLNSKLHEIKHEKEHAEQGTKVMTKALELLDSYKYTGEVPESVPGQRPWMGAGSEPFIS